MGDTKVGPFEIPETLAREWLPLRNPQRLWIVDFPPGMTEVEEAQYEAPFEYIRKRVKPIRAGNKRRAYAERWWIHAEARPEMRGALKGLPRYLVTPTVSKHRVFVWLEGRTLPDHQLIVFAHADEYFFGVLHSRPHELWALRLGTRLETRPRYTPTTCFETFPFPKPTRLQEQAIADAARRLDEARRNWLGDRSDSQRTLTALYNKQPSWLVDAHRVLNTAVFAAYSWDSAMGDEQILDQLFALNLSSSATN